MGFLDMQRFSQVLVQLLVITNSIDLWPFKNGLIGTVTPAPNFNAEADCAALRKAMKGVRTDEMDIIKILCYRSNAQRQELKIKYKSQYGQDLVDELKNDLSGEFEDVMVGLMMPIQDFAAYSVKKALRRRTGEAALIEIICTATNEELIAIKEAYNRLYKKPMEKAVQTHLSGDFKTMIVSLIMTRRETEGPVNMALASNDAKALYDAGEGKWGTDVSEFNRILCLRSYAQLRATFDEYNKFYGHSIMTAIKREMSGYVDRGYLALVRSITDRPSFFAERLYRSMKGSRTDHDDLVRLIVFRCEIDMVQIKEAFLKLNNNHGKSLASFIKENTTGDFEKSLLALIREK